MIKRDLMIASSRTTAVIGALGCASRRNVQGQPPRSDGDDHGTSHAHVVAHWPVVVRWFITFTSSREEGEDDTPQQIDHVPVDAPDSITVSPGAARDCGSSRTRMPSTIRPMSTWISEPR